MPELPEVEAARRAIEEHCIGKKIVKAIIADDNKVIDGRGDDFKASLEGKTIVAAKRKGKNMWLELDSPPFPTFEFGMAGAIYIKGVAVTKYKRSAVKDDDEWPSKYSKVFLEVMESHQASKLDTSGTAKAVISCFQKLGVSFDLDEVQLIRDPQQQVEMVGVPEEYLLGHAFHMYHLTSPDGTVSFEFQHNVCGRSINAEGTVDAILFLAKKVKSKADKRIYDMIDVLREGNMR